MKYPNGYLEKIAYHLRNGNVSSMIYFVNQHISKYGIISPSEAIKIEEMVNQ